MKTMKLMMLAIAIVFGTSAFAMYKVYQLRIMQSLLLANQTMTDM
ncbi:hypothetical protein [uncultured Dysgonomonas sp.]|nr:hypothetical protein [uncultured Dysgonomonas sp.]